VSVAVLVGVRAALAAYLQAHLTTSNPELVVSSEWPTPGVALPAKAITVVAVGPPQTEFHPPCVLSTTPTGNHLGTVVYSFGRVTLGLQLDCWATFAAVRDALAVELEAALTRMPTETLGITTAPSLSRRGGLVLRITALANALCDFRFEAVPSFQETSDAAQAGEWRATWQGTAFVHLLATETDFPILERVILDFGGGDTRTIPTE
jgi:hypothetical protein